MVYQVVTGTPGHPDQFLYIDIWQTLAAHPPWLKKCFEDNCKIMMVRETDTGTIKRNKKRKMAPPLMLQRLPSMEEWQQVVQAALHWFEAHDPNGRMMCKPMPRQLFQKMNPAWDQIEAEGQDNLHRFKEALRELKEALMAGLREGGRNAAINMNKVSEILQKYYDNPPQFYERLCKACHLYSPFNPELPKNQQMIIVAFVGETQRDIRRKLQKLEGYAGMKASQLLKVATKVFVN
jgi:hypothetical protein